MAKYCFDTSGFSNPNELIPGDIHQSMWDALRQFVTNRHVAVNKEIFDEMTRIAGGFGDFIKASKPALLLEVGDDGWDWTAYVNHNKRMQTVHKNCISEYRGNVRTTICLNDLSIIALAKTLELPLVHMETPVGEDKGSWKRRIPNICNVEQVKHMSFNEFCRAEGFKF